MQSQLFSKIAKATLVVCAVSATAFLAAADSYTPNNSCAPSNCGTNSCCLQDNCIQAPACGWGYNPSAHLQCGNNPCCGALDNLSGRFDVLYWRPCSDGLQLGTEESFTSSAIGATSVTTNESHAIDPKFKFETGFRLGLGYYCPCDCWDVSLNWTHFHAKASAHAVGDATTVVPYTIFVNDWERIDGSTSTAADSRWSLNLDLLDLELAQKYYVNHCFVLRPFIGLRAARIDQNYHVASARATATGAATTDFNSTVKSTSDFRGIGPRAGMDVQIKLGCGLSIVGGAAASLVFGSFDRHAHETRLGGSAVTPPNFEYNAHGGGPDRCTVTMADLGIGLAWEHCFECCNSSHPFALVFAWENHAFYDLNHFNFASQGVASGGTTVNGRSEGKVGDLTTQGLTVSFMVGF